MRRTLARIATLSPGDGAPAFRMGLAAWTGRLRLVTGLVLFTFAATHLLNHALGLVSIDAMESVRDLRIAVTRSLPGTLVLAVSFLTHIVLGIVKFARRRTWRVTPLEAVQLGFGLLIPAVLLRHFIGMRVAHELYDVDDNYVYALWAMWPAEVWNQSALILLVWVHGCIGLYYWLRLKSWFAGAKWALYGLAVLVPVLGFSGFVAAGREVRFLIAFENPLTPEQLAALKTAMNTAFFGYLAFVAALLSLRLMRKLYERFLPRIRIAYVGGPTVVSPVGPTLLEISRSFGIPHASVCGGRARCSTCRVRVLDGLDTLPVPNDAERLVLARVGAAPNVRLACQLRPNRDIRIATLLPASRVLPEDVLQLDKFLWGVEQNVAILFADLRGFTRFSERRLPYDVVFFLNQYLGQVGQAIEDVGGYVDKFMGDGIMAIFGLDRGPEVAARQALAAAKSIGGVLDALNSSLRTELPERLEIGIGIHTGPAILGRVGVAGGAGATQRITALGDTVNAASRLESSCKEHKAQLIVSADTAAAASLDLSGYQRERIQVKGRSEPLDVFVVRRAVDVPLAGPWSASPTRAKSEAAVRPQTAA